MIDDQEFFYFDDMFKKDKKYDEGTGRSYDYYTGDDEFLEEE